MYSPVLLQINGITTIFNRAIQGNYSEKCSKNAFKDAQNIHLTNSCTVIFHNGFPKNRLRDDFKARNKHE